MDSVSTPALRLIVGLGNPGREYAGTRHNVGFMIVDRLAQRRGGEWTENSRFQSALTSREGVWMCKPLSFMNRSGAPVRAFADYYKIVPSEMLVIYDEAALPLGRLRVRRAGSSAGHNGMQSIIDHFGTSEIARLRVGIGAADGSRGLVNHVLGRFSRDEDAVLKTSLDRAVDAVDCILKDGIEAAMNLYNQNHKQP